MLKVLKKIKTIVSGQIEIIGLLIKEYMRMCIHQKYRRMYAMDEEVCLCGLRTSAHVIDKSLNAERWEPKRGSQKYNKMCTEIEALKGSVYSNDPSFVWALKIKNEYEKAQQVQNVTHYQHRNEFVEIEREQLIRLIKSRRSTRTFIDKIISEPVLNEILASVNWAPSSCNRQPIKLFVTQNRQKVKECISLCAGATCISETIPCFISVCADTRCYMLKDRNLPFIDTSLGIQNMLLLSHISGIGCTILNWMHHTVEEESKLRTILEIPEYYLVVLNIVAGFTTTITDPPGRKDNTLTFKVID